MPQDPGPATPHDAQEIIGAWAAACAQRSAAAQGSPMATSSSHPPLFTAASRRSDLVAAYPEVDGVFERLGFSGEMTLGDWCLSPDWALLELARAAKPPPPPAACDWSMVTIPELIQDIIVTHHLPLRRELGRLGVLIRSFCARHPEFAQIDLDGLASRFSAEVTIHIDHEEAVVFPLSIAIEAASRGQQEAIPASKDVTAAIRFMSLGHEDAAGTIRRLMGLLHVVPMRSADPDIAVISEGLNALHADMVIHAYKEESILLPAVVFADEQIAAGAHLRLRPISGSRAEGDSDLAVSG